MNLLACNTASWRSSMLLPNWYTLDTVLADDFPRL